MRRLLFFVMLIFFPSFLYLLNVPRTSTYHHLPASITTPIHMIGVLFTDSEDDRFRNGKLTVLGAQYN